MAGVATSRNVTTPITGIRSRPGMPCTVNAVMKEIADMQTRINSMNR